MGKHGSAGGGWREDTEEESGLMVYEKKSGNGIKYHSAPKSNRNTSLLRGCSEEKSGGQLIGSLKWIQVRRFWVLVQTWRRFWVELTRAARLG